MVGDEIEIFGNDFIPSTEFLERQARIIFTEDEVSVGDPIGDVEIYEELDEVEIGYEGDRDAGEFEYTFEVPDVLNDGEDLFRLCNKCI